MTDPINKNRCKEIVKNMVLKRTQRTWGHGLRTTCLTRIDGHPNMSWTIMDNHGHPGPVWGCSPKHLSNHFLELHGPFATGWYFSGKCYNWEYLSGWWFGTFLIFPYIGNSHPNWLMRTPPALCEQLTNIFQRGSNHQPAMVGHDQYWIPSGFIKHSWKVDHKSQWFSQIETSIYPEDFPAMFDETRG